MILLDTNVLSALVNPGGAGPVLDWLNRQTRDAIGTTAVTAYELRSGTRRPPQGSRRTDLEARLARLLDGPILDGRILPFDRRAAEAAADLHARRLREGRPIDFADTLIAGIAIAHGATLATRNLRHFADLPGISVVDPFAF